MAGWGAGLAGRGWTVAKGAQVVAGPFSPIGPDRDGRAAWGCMQEVVEKMMDHWGPSHCSAP